MWEMGLEVQFEPHQAHTLCFHVMNSPIGNVGYSCMGCSMVPLYHTFDPSDGLVCNHC